MSLQRILSDTPSQMPDEEFLRKLWEARSNDEGALSGGLIKAIRTITGISDHFAKKVQDFLVKNGFASRNKQGSGSAPGWKLDPAKFVKPEPQEEAPAEELSPSLSERLVAERRSQEVTLRRAADRMSDIEDAEAIVERLGGDPERIKRVFAEIEQIL